MRGSLRNSLADYGLCLQEATCSFLRISPNRRKATDNRASGSPKQVGTGTGQGLALAHDVIVNTHGGSIALESESGKGSTFIIRLPLHETRSDAAIAA